MNTNPAFATYLEFECFVAELLEALGFENVTSVGGATDKGFDIQAIYHAQTPTGVKISQLWLVDIEHYRSGNKVGVDTLARLSGILRVKSGEKALLVTSSNLTSAARAYVQKFNASFDGKLEIWDRDILTSLLVRLPELQAKYKSLISDFPLSLSSAQTPKHDKLIARLSNCPAGKAGWQEFENIGTTILKEVFTPPLKSPKPQSRTLNGLERRDALFPLRGAEGGWEKIRQEFEAKFLLCEFKNCSEPFSKDEVNQTRNYLRDTIGKLGVVFSRRGPDGNALKMRNSIYSQEKKVILFFEDEHLVELLRLKISGQNPLDLIQDAIDDFYISHE